MRLRANATIPNRWLLAPPALALLLALALALVSCTSGANPAADAGPSVRTVHATEVQPRAQAEARSFSGTVRAPLETNLSFRVAGQVADVRVDVGETVRAGETVARLDPEDYRLQVESAEASYRQAQAAAENAKAELQRIKALYANDNASLSTYDQARTRYETTQNRAEAAKRQLALAKKRLGYTRLTAPASGSVAAKRVEAGENVAVGQPVVRLTSGERLEVQVQVPEDMVTAVEVGHPVTVTTGSKVEAVPATVTEVASAPGGARPTYPVVVTLDRPVERLRSGMTARVAFTPDDASGLVVPAEAVAQGAGRRFVYVVTPSAADSLDADGRVERRTVATGDLLSSGLVITSGLQAGDRVVTAGLTKIQDGDPVRISRLLSEN